MNNENKLNIALTIAGSDPTGGAGLQADLRAFWAMGVYGISVASALTAQSTAGVSGIFEPPPDFFSAELDKLLGDIYPDALKTGMIHSPEIAGIIAVKIKEYSLKNLVIDPVMISSTGVSLARQGTVETMKKKLFPLALVITPNVDEASALSGIDIKNEDSAKDAAQRLKESVQGTVIVTGLKIKDRTLDLLFDGRDFLFLENETLEGEYHGTGCVFSSVITACIASGYKVDEAAVKAKEFVWKAMKNAVAVGKGMKVLGF